MLLRPWTRPRTARAARTVGVGVASAPSWTSASAGAVSSAKPPPPRTTSGPEDWNAGPSTWDRHAARSGSRDSARGVRVGSSIPSTSPAASTIDCQPVQRHRCARSAPSTSRRDERAVGTALVERGQAHQDPRRAEAALARAAGGEGGGPTVALVGREPLDRRHAAAGDAAHRRDARHPGRAVDPDGATPALALRAAAILERATAELLAQRIEQRDAVGDGHGTPVEIEHDAGRIDRVETRGTAAALFGGGTGAAQGAGCPDGRGLS